MDIRICRGSGPTTLPHRSNVPVELDAHPVLSGAEVQAMQAKAQEMFISGKVDAAFGDQLFLTIWANVKGLKAGFKSTDGETLDYSSE